MANKRYISTKSDYTFKKKHKSLSEGTIYESDYMTISPIESLFNEGEYVLQDSNFRFGTRVGSNLQKKHKRGNWVPNNACSATPYVWTTECLDRSGLTNDDKIILKPDYTSLNQFAYYGSACNLVKGSINDIILHFPAEMYFTDDDFLVSYKDSDGNLLYKSYGNGYKKVSNDYSIDIHTLKVNENEVYETLRYFALSFESYDIIDKDNKITDITTWEVDSKSAEKCKDGKALSGGTLAEVTINDINLLVYKDYNTEKIGIAYNNTGYSGYRIRPKQYIIDNYFERIDDFEKVLLNRKTNPLYKATFKTPKETNTGVKYTMRKYVWPCRYGYNPDLEDASFDVYYKMLYDLAEFHDGLDCDNMWRNMTHEAIKNLDWSYVRSADDVSEELDKIDTTKVEPIIKMWGRVYDDLKRYIDNIKACNKVSYDEKNNVPDYFLDEQLQLDGWETKNIFREYSGNNSTNKLYASQSKGYTYGEANAEFFRRLKINSKYIQRAKGTRKGIEALLGVLGFNKGEYLITETVAIAHPNDLPYASGFAIENKAIETAKKEIGIKYPLAREVKAINKSRTGFYSKHGFDELGGIPVKSISLFSGSTEVAYVVPWYDNTTEYDGGLYYQMYGGWGKKKEKKISLEIAPNVKVLSGDTEGLQIYDETESHLHFINTLQELRELSAKECRQDTIAYVTDVSNLDTLYGFKDDTEKAKMLSGEVSHYFVLENTELNFHLGYSESDRLYGWRNVLIEEITGQTSYHGKLVLYLESIENNANGNNPHIGTDYDDGNEYLKRMGQIFYYPLNNEELTSYDDEQCSAITNYGFTISSMTDNQKCWFFSDTNNKHDSAYVSDPEDGESLVRVFVSGLTVTKGANSAVTVLSGNCINPENGKDNDEAAANSLINVKNMHLTLYYSSASTEEYIDKFKDFVEDDVMFYVKQIIPSTSIFSYAVLSGGTWGGGGKKPEPTPPGPEPYSAVTEWYQDDCYLYSGDIRENAYVVGITQMLVTTPIAIMTDENGSNIKKNMTAVYGLETNQTSQNSYYWDDFDDEENFK